MKLWVITQNKFRWFDSFDAAIVAADTEEEAREINPCDGDSFNSRNFKEDYYRNHGWPESDFVQVKYIGEAAEGTKAGTILASFNAG